MRIRSWPSGASFDLWQVFWHRALLGAGRFLAISAFCGAVALPSVLGMLTVFVLKLGLELTQLLPATHEAMTPARKSALILLQPLLGLTVARWRPLGGAGMLCGLAESALPVIGLFGFVFLLVGEFLERALYFKAVVALKMPGSH